MFYDTSYARPNFRAVTFAFVEKVLFSTPLNGTNPRATGVKYSKYDDNGVKQFYTVNANKEVIVSAGALQAPQLLMVSGIGARKELEEYGIDVVVENQWVGKNLQETASTSLIYHAHPNASTSALSDPTKDAYRAAAAYEYEQNRTGALTAWDGITGAFSPPFFPFCDVTELTLSFAGPAFSFQRFSDEDLVKYGATDFLNNSDTSHIEQILCSSSFPSFSSSVPSLPLSLSLSLSLLSLSLIL
jgi:choline dehydrogenase-like flavoprotein